MKKFKKIIAMGCAAVMAMSVMCVSAFAADNESLDKNEVVEYNLSTFVKDGDKIVEKVATDAEKVEYMRAHGRMPGTTFDVGNKRYLVTDNYDLSYIGEIESENNLVQSFARGTSIPTSQGSLPYNGSYSLSSYLYTNRYFKVGASYNRPSISVAISANDAQTIGVSYIDMRVNESMGNHSKYLSKNGVWEFLDWVYGGEKFCIKLFNAGGSNWISGSFTVSVDQID